MLIVVALIAALCGLTTSGLDHGAALPLVFGVLFVFGFSAIGWNGVFMAEIARLAPDGRVGGATGAVLTVTFLGVILAPMAFTGLHALTGAYTTVFGIMAVVSLTGSLLMLAQRRGARSRTL
jgi:MFS family permease